MLYANPHSNECGNVPTSPPYMFAMAGLIAHNETPRVSLERSSVLIFLLHHPITFSLISSSLTLKTPSACFYKKRLATHSGRPSHDTASLTPRLGHASATHRCVGYSTYLDYSVFSIKLDLHNTNFLKLQLQIKTLAHRTCQQRDSQILPFSEIDTSACRSTAGATAQTVGIFDE